MAEAALAAFDLLGGEEYLAAFRRAHGWFHGRNSLKQPLVDVRSGACCDGLQASGVNRNQGAESTLAYLWTEMSNREILRLHGDNPQGCGCRQVNSRDVVKEAVIHGNQLASRIAAP